MTGKLALSKAGHDKDKLYLIVKEEQDTVYLADGRRRGLLNPKKKNRRHIQVMHLGVTEEELELFFQNPAWADNRIRETIELYNRRMKPE